MSSDVIARVEAFAEKATELCKKGHVLRAAENYGRAAEAARALGEDNLVVLHMQVRRANMLSVYSTAVMVTSTTADPRVLAAHRAECIALFSGAVEVLECRRLADTLLEGKCAPGEEVWRTFTGQQCNTNTPAAGMATLAALVGYEGFLHAAAYVVDVLRCAGRFAAECSVEQFQSFARFVVHAAELMQQPRRHGGVALDNS